MCIFTKSFKVTSKVSVRYNKYLSIYCRLLVAKTNAVACYNGNYEGDTTMFKKNSFQLLDTDSDVDYNGDCDIHCRALEYKVTVWEYGRRWTTTRINRMEKVANVIAKVQRNFFYQKFIFLLNILLYLILLILRLGITVVAIIGNWSYGLWRSKAFLRNISRKFLWWLTLSTCNDITLFVVILVATPILFMISMVGLIISLYCKMKECLAKWSVNVYHQFVEL